MKRGKWFFSLIVIILVWGLGRTGTVAANEVIQVGCVDYGDFIIYNDEKHTYEGYGAEYFKKLSYVSGYQYQFHLDTWENCQKKLNTGEYDLICPIVKTDTREKNYAFSSFFIGMEETVLYTRTDNRELYYEDFNELNGSVIGLLEGSYQEVSLKKFAGKKGFSYVEKLYNSKDELKRALENYEIDVIALGGLAGEDSLKEVSHFDAQSCYLMYRKQNNNLARNIDDAIGIIKMKSPEFETKLYQKYYQEQKAYSEPLFTKEELEFIERGETIEIGMFRNYYPYTDCIDGKMVGICEELLHEIEEKSGLKFKTVPIDNSSDPEQELLSRSGIDIMGGMMRSEKYILNEDLQTSEGIIEFDYVVITQKNKTVYTLNGKKVALPKSFSYMKYYVEKNYPEANVYVYQDNDSCLEAVYKGDADITIQNEYLGGYSLQKPRYEELTMASGLEIPGESCIVANRDIDPVLFSVIDKSISCISQKYREQIVNSYTIANPYIMTMPDAIYKYRYFIILLSVMLVAIVSLWWIMNKKRMKILIQKREAENYQRKIEMNELTGLYTTAAYHQRIEELLDAGSGGYCILILNIEKFKIINDLIGMSEGDRLLAYLSDFIRKEAEKCRGVAGYLGADIFSLCVEKERLGAFSDFEQRMHRYLNRYPLDFEIRVRIGVYEVENRIPANLMCDRARLAAERVKGNELIHYMVYDNSMREKMIEDQQVLNEMQNALDKEEFVIYIQPKCDLVTGKLVGGEVLVRWIHPTQGMIPPYRFIPLFEKNGFIAKLDYYVWEKTCQLLARWKKNGISIPLSVNASRLNFYLQGSIESFLQLITDYDLEERQLEMEVTESAYTKDSDQIFSQLEELQHRGVRILMDDFGSGYSSLNMLQEAPMDVLKLDMKFLLGNDDRGRGKIIIESIVKMAYGLGFEVIAEGVETEEQISKLLQAGCQTGQGYFFSKPIPVEEFEEKYFGTV